MIVRIGKRVQPFGMECGNWRMMSDLFGYDLEILAPEIKLSSSSMLDLIFIHYIYWMLSIYIKKIKYLNSNVSPSRGLKGFPILSRLEANAETANVATHCNLISALLELAAVFSKYP